jgi:hypothetical protein
MTIIIGYKSIKVVVLNSKNMLENSNQNNVVIRK